MGRYFGLNNSTKRHSVSSYWKGSPPSSKEVIKIAAFLGWDLRTDRITSHSYEDGYTWNGESFGVVEDAYEDEAKEPEIEAIEVIVPLQLEPVEEGAANKKFGWDGTKVDPNTFDGTFFCN